MTNWKYSLNWSCSKLGEKMISLQYIFVLPLWFLGQIQTIYHWQLFRCSPVNRNLCASCAGITSNDSSVRFQLAHSWSHKSQKRLQLVLWKLRGYAVLARKKPYHSLQSYGMQTKSIHLHLHTCVCKENYYQGDKILMQSVFRLKWYFNYILF